MGVFPSASFYESVRGRGRCPDIEREGAQKGRAEIVEPPQLPAIHFLQRGTTLRSNGKCSNENDIMDIDLMEYDLIG